MKRNTDCGARSTECKSPTQAKGAMMSLRPEGGIRAGEKEGNKGCFEGMKKRKKITLKQLFSGILVICCFILIVGHASYKTSHSHLRSSFAVPGAVIDARVLLYDNSEDFFRHKRVVCIGSYGHKRYPSECSNLSFQKFGRARTKNARNFRIAVAPNEFVYHFVMQTNFARVFESSVYHGAKGTIIYDVKQTSHFGAAYACAQNLLPKSVEYCACRDAYGASDTKFAADYAVPAGEHIVMTSFFTHKKDPQRGRQVSDGFDYIRNFYISIRALGMSAVMFHTGLSQSLVSRFETQKIRFIEVHKPEESMSTNDYRFKVYLDFLHANAIDIEWVLFADASDVFFNMDPFVYMTNHRDGHDLFMSPDIGTFESNPWMKKKLNICYKDKVKEWTSEWRSKLHNAGVWGGNRNVIECMLKCVWDNLRLVTRGRGNCNMPAVNYCAHFGNCLIDGRSLDDFSVPASAPTCYHYAGQGKKCGVPSFVNPFRKQCDIGHAIIHNKCGPSEKVECIEHHDGKLVKTKSWPCEGEDDILRSFGVKIIQESNMTQP